MSNSIQVSLLAIFVCIPRTPFVYRSTDTSILNLPSFAGKGENVGNKHLRNALLVMDNIHGSVSPGYLRAYRRLRLANNHRDTVDNIHQVEPLSAFLAGTREFPLVRDDIIILFILVTEEPDIDVITVIAEWIGILLEKQFTESVICRYHLIGVASDGNGCTEFIDNLFCLVRCDGIQSQECLQQPFSNQDIIVCAGNILGLYIGPAILFCHIDEHLLNGVVLVKICHGIVCYLTQIF